MASTAPRAKANFARFAPLKIALIYIILTFALALFGPVDYVEFARMRTAIFIGFVLLAISVGYFIGVRSLELSRAPARTLSSRQTLAFLDISLYIALGGLFWSVADALIAGSLNTSLSGLGEAYHSAYEGYSRNSGTYSLVFVLYSLTLPFAFIASVLGIFHFRSLDNWRRGLVLLLVVGGLLFYVIGSGKQKQIGDVLIYLIAIGAIKYGIRGKRISVKIMAQAIIGAVLAVAAFVAVLGQRYAALNIGVFNINERAHPRMNFDFDHPVFDWFGDDYGFGLSVFSSYLSQGYYGLSLALGTDWEWTKMSGFSYSLSVIFNRFLGLEWQWPNTLVARVGTTTGWGESKWHTAFTHFASDFTWPGTVLLFGFFGFVYARAWLYSIRYANPYAILMFTMMTLGMFFVPANNQLFHAPGFLFTVVVISVLYLRNGHAQAAVLVRKKQSIRPRRQRARVSYP